ncbi:hypothetical protein, partial [Klebsiella pneumoniae]|uniref:hypothetical protein n=1 Tax=Klebsiella pneumoniae TaxID=573 RepID=UPI001E35710A
MPAFEWVHVQLHQQKGMISLSPPTICNSAPSAEQRSQLEMLLGPTDCSRLSLLESLKKGPVTISGPAFNEA